MGHPLTIHYHGTPISPRAVLDTLAGRHFCVSFAKSQDIEICHRIGRGVMIDNGAFSVWRRGIAVDWSSYYRWLERWLVYPTTWAVIPDVIDGDESQNDALIEAWPHGTRGAPVWHMHESIGRLLRLAEEWPLVCIGSSGDYRTLGTARWHGRMTTAMNALCEDGCAPPAELHMMRGMAMAGSHYPFARVDSTDVGRNHNRPQNTAIKMALRWETQHCPAVWRHRPQHVGDLLMAAQ